MKRVIAVLLSLIIAIPAASCAGNKDESGIEESDNSAVETITKTEKQISNDELYDKILGSWVGQAAGVVWGATTEFKYAGKVIPENEVPSSDNLDMAGMLTQDDIYVEIPFIQAMLANGVDCGNQPLADAFKNTSFPLWHANLASRENLKNGINPPLSGSPLYNDHSDDIDWQIEADFVGQIYPGLVNNAAERAFEIGHIMNYGDGVYGGVFVAAMHSAAFFAKDVKEIIDAGVKAIPEGTTFRQVMDEVLKVHAEGKTWEQCWQQIETKWGKGDKCSALASSDLNIDAKLNSAYILIGLLYGNGDFEKSMEISMRCGQDSDCNPSSVGAILGNFYGYKALDAKWKPADLKSGKFQFTEFTLSDCVDSNMKLVKEALGKKGFSEKDGVWTIMVHTKINPVKYEQLGEETMVDIALTDNSGLVMLKAKVVSNSEIVSYEWNMGDGASYNVKDPSHTYNQKGEYKITLKITDKNGKTATAEKTIKIEKLSSDYDKTDVGKVRNIASISIPACTVSLPQGVGAKSLSVLCDGVKTGSSTEQYDTFDYKTEPYEQFFAYMFPVEFVVSSFVFTEGMHFDNGGWFMSGDVRIEVLVNGEWKKADSSVSPAYPDGNNKASFGNSFETYTFTLDNVKCSGIRIIGLGGGAASFISAAEIEVFAVEANK